MVTGRTLQATVPATCSTVRRTNQLVPRWGSAGTASEEHVTPALHILRVVALYVRAHARAASGIWRLASGGRRASRRESFAGGEAGRGHSHSWAGGRPRGSLARSTPRSRLGLSPRAGPESVYKTADAETQAARPRVFDVCSTADAREDPRFGWIDSARDVRNAVRKYLRAGSGRPSRVGWAT